MVVTSAPRLAPSSLSCTPATPTLSVAFAVTVTVAETFAPPAGAMMDTDGGVASFDTVTVTTADVVTLPAASRATAIRAWLPLAVPGGFQGAGEGEGGSSAPRLAPSSLDCTPPPPTLSVAVAVSVVGPAPLAP